MRKPEITPRMLEIAARLNAAPDSEQTRAEFRTRAAADIAYLLRKLGVPEQVCPTCKTPRPQTLQ